MNILDDELVEPPENIVISITPTGPTQEFIDLFDIVQEETVVQIIDDDSEISLNLSTLVILIGGTSFVPMLSQLPVEFNRLLLP